MVKFIIEVDDEYLKEKFDTDKMISRISDEKSLAEVLMDALVYSYLKKEIGDGVSEFTVSSIGMEGEKKELFDRAFRGIVALAQAKVLEENHRDKEAEKDEAVK